MSLNQRAEFDGPKGTSSRANESAAVADVETMNERSTEMATKRRPKVPRLYGVFEVGQALDVAVTNLAESVIEDGRGPAGLPEPVMKLKATRIWLADEIDEFAIEYKARRAARRPRKKAGAAA